MAMWTFDSNLGYPRFTEQTPPQNEEERRRLAANNANQLPGTAGYGSMWTSTNGGAQRTYNPAMSNQPLTGGISSVGTGRQVPMTASEALRQTNLQNIISSVGTIGQSNTLANRLSVITEEAKTAAGRAVPTVTKGFTEDQINRMISGELTPASAISSLKSVSTQAAEGYKKEQEKAINDLTSKIAEVEKSKLELSNLYSQNKPSEASEDSTMKERAAYSQALNRLRSTGVLPVAEQARTLLEGVTTQPISEILSTISRTAGSITPETYGGTDIDTWISNLGNRPETIGLVPGSGLENSINALRSWNKNLDYYKSQYDKVIRGQPRGKIYGDVTIPTTQEWIRKLRNQLLGVE